MNEYKTDDESNSLARPRNLVWAGYAVFIWGIAYMLPHLYWALGGTIGLSLLKPLGPELPFELINGIASIILTLAGLLGIALIYFWNRKPLNLLLQAIAWAGCSLATSHGIYGIIYRLLQIIGIVPLESGPFNMNEHDFVLWDLLLFEPWFLIEGILLAVLGWYSFKKPSDRRIWLMLCVIGVIIGIITGLLGVKVY